MKFAHCWRQSITPITVTQLRLQWIKLQSNTETRWSLRNAVTSSSVAVSTDCSDQTNVSASLLHYWDDEYSNCYNYFIESSFGCFCVVHCSLFVLLRRNHVLKDDGGLGGDHCTVFPPTLSPLPFPSFIPFPSLLSSLSSSYPLFLPLPSPFHPFPPPLHSPSLKQLWGLGERCKPPSGSGQSPAAAKRF